MNCSPSARRDRRSSATALRPVRERRGNGWISAAAFKRPGPPVQCSNCWERTASARPSSLKSKRRSSTAISPSGSTRAATPRARIGQRSSRSPIVTLRSRTPQPRKTPSPKDGLYACRSDFVGLCRSFRLGYTLEKRRPVSPPAVPCFQGCQKKRNRSDVVRHPSAELLSGEVFLGFFAHCRGAGGGCRFLVHRAGLVVRRPTGATRNEQTRGQRHDR